VLQVTYVFCGRPQEGEGYGPMLTKVDKREDGSIVTVFLRTSFMDDSYGLRC